MGKVQKCVGREVFKLTSIPSHSSQSPSPRALAEVEPRAELAEAVAVEVVEVAVVGAGGQAGEVHLHGEVQRPVRGRFSSK